MKAHRLGLFGIAIILLIEHARTEMLFPEGQPAFIK